MPPHPPKSKNTKKHTEHARFIYMFVTVAIMAIGITKAFVSLRTIVIIMQTIRTMQTVLHNIEGLPYRSSDPIRGRDT